MNGILRNHALYFIEYLACIVISHLIIEYFFHVPEIVKFGPIYVSVLILVFCVWFFNFYRDARALSHAST